MRHVLYNVKNKTKEERAMTTVYLIRHAEAEGNLYRRAHGHYDATITDNGYRQIAALAKRFEHERIDAVYASDLVRTQTTALALTGVHGLPLHTTERLREVCVGEWEDRTWTWLAKFDRERLIAFNTDAGSWRVEGGETMEQVRERMTDALREIIAAHPEQTVALFSHGMALRLLVGTLQGLSIREIDGTGHGENTAVTKLEADENGIRVVYTMDASHLSEELTTLHKQLWTKNKGGIEPGIWFAPDGEIEGRFDVMQEDDAVGAVAVGRCEDGIAALEEFWLDEAAQGSGLGVRLVGQAISYARSRGCDTLRTTIPRDDPVALRCAMKYGFAAVQGTPRYMLMEKYFGCNEDYRRAKFDEAWAEIKE